MRTAPAITAAGPKPIAEAAAVYDAAVARVIEAAEERHRAEVDLTAAKAKRAADVRAAAEQGRALPSTSALEKAEQRVADARERLRETKNVALGRGRSLTRAVAEHAGDWRGQLVEQLTAADARLEAARAEYVASVEAAADARLVGDWIARAERAVASATNSDDLPAVLAPASVLGPHSPLDQLERFHAWLAAGGADPPHVRPSQAEPEAA
jgi:hypothetical protein